MSISLSNFAPTCRRLIIFGQRLMTNQSISRDFSSTNKNFAAKPGGAVNIGGLGKASKKKLGKLGPVAEKTVLSVETDTKKLRDFVCGSNLQKEGGEEIQVKPDSEYPDWLWTIRTGKFPELSEMDPESKEYWLKVRRMGRWNNNILMKRKRF
ncbi:large ribosomal subunit protein mL54 [Cloeon dipterum]|uniref:large ribosomal subunit protein mL54 n=1 Tax=Cloeon dipterum TaxID=197152 RepID=UPI00321FBA91